MPHPLPPQTPDVVAEREYIGSMCRELAQMARFGGDEHLAVLLETAGRAATRQTPQFRLVTEG